MSTEGIYEYPASVVRRRVDEITALRKKNARLHAHIDRDHAVMVKLGRIADAAVQMLEHVNMDTDEDRELHARAVGALRARLDEMAATMNEANEAARDIPEVPGDR